MNKKYCVLDLVKKIDSLEYSSWYLASEWEQHNYNEYKLVELNVDKGECTLSTREYDRSVGEIVERHILVDPCEVFLTPSSVTEFRYQEILTKIPEHLREELKDIVSDKCHHSAVAGYNGCI